MVLGYHFIRQSIFFKQNGKTIIRVFTRF
jgi:hypothetical protein